MAYTQDQINSLVKEGPFAYAQMSPALLRQLLDAYQANSDQTRQRDLLQTIDSASGGIPVDQNGSGSLIANRGPNGLVIQGTDPTTGRPFIYDPQTGKFESNAGGRWHDSYDSSGNWTGRDLASSGWVDFRDGVVKPAAAMAAMWAGGQGLSALGAGGAATPTATGITGGAVTLTPAEIAAGVTMPTAAEVGSLMPTISPGMIGGTAGAITGGAVSLSPSEIAAGAGGPTTGQVYSTLPKSIVPTAPAGGGLLNSSTLGKLAGAAIGAASGQDQQQSSNQSRDPWAPAQPLLKDLITQAQTLNNQYQQTPFNDAQKTGYNNIGGLLNNINSQAGGLLSGFGANASGANNYDRSNPRKQLTGSSFNLSGFAPGLLNFFPKG